MKKNIFVLIAALFVVSGVFAGVMFENATNKMVRADGREIPDANKGEVIRVNKGARPASAAFYKTIQPGQTREFVTGIGNDIYVRVGETENKGIRFNLARTRAALVIKNGGHLVTVTKIRFLNSGSKDFPSYYVKLIAKNRAGEELISPPLFAATFSGSSGEEEEED